MSAWHSLIDLPVVSAEISCEGTSFYNVGGNNLFDPGETGQASVKLRNSGGMDATALTATLISSSPYVTIVDGSASFGDIAAGSAIENILDRFTSPSLQMRSGARRPPSRSSAISRAERRTRHRSI